MTPTLTYRPGAGGVGVDVDSLVTSRALIQANSGGGKSRAIRQLLEETHGRVPQIVLDPEGEFSTLRERFPYILAGRDGDVPADPRSAKLLCRRLLELGASTVVDLYDLKLPDRRRFVRLFLEELMALPRELWRPTLVVIDEAHVFAPERGSGESESTDAVITLCTQGRKRGFCAILATQRLSKLHKDAAAELLNKLIGRTGLDVDVRRAGDELGFDKDERQALKTLAPGEFFAYGPAIAREVTKVRTGAVTTTHPEAGRMVSAAPTPASAAVQKMLEQLRDLPKQAEEEAKTVADLERLVKDLRRDLAAAQKTAPVPDPAAIERAVKAAVDNVEARWRSIVRDRDAQVRARIDSAIDALQHELTQLRAPETAAVPSDATLAARAVVRAVPTNPTAGALASTAAFRVVARAMPAEGLSNPQQRILDALASFEALGLDPVSKSNVAVFSNQSPRSSGWRNNVRALAAGGYIERVGGDALRLTDAGRAIASAEAPASLEELHDAWAAKLSGPQRLMLRLLIGAYPRGVERDALAKSSGQSPLSSGYRNNLSTLSSLGLMTKQNGEYVATRILFPEGLP